ncbi:Hint domain-containing protein [uncultured Sulfitobacter sp.]|uniref:Hint domain-containing protein n=1 Tax=uncultured Sulfitobacter sp. TaxID=191468 RepID=UPI003457FDCD
MTQTPLPSHPRLVIDRDPHAPQNGVMRFLDGAGVQVDAVPFEGADAASPCFTPGTMIATPRGEVAVDRLAIGDRVITRDNGLQHIRWIGRREMTPRDFYTNEHLAPVRIAKGALGNDLPERDMMISPNHRILVANDKTPLHFEDSEVLVAAKHLTGLNGVDVVQDMPTTYLHLMFDNHEVILSDGTWSESFQPDVRTLVGIGNAQRLELLEVFPELATPEGLRGYSAARRSVAPRDMEPVK